MAGPEPGQGIRLLPYFDPYLIGAHPRTQLFAQLESEVDRIGTILQAQPELTPGPITAGPHA